MSPQIDSSIARVLLRVLLYLKATAPDKYKAISGINSLAMRPIIEELSRVLNPGEYDSIYARDGGDWPAEDLETIEKVLKAHADRREDPSRSIDVIEELAEVLKYRFIRNIISVNYITELREAILTGDELAAIKRIEDKSFSCNGCGKVIDHTHNEAITVSHPGPGQGAGFPVVYCHRCVAVRYLACSNKDCKGLIDIKNEGHTQTQCKQCRVEKVKGKPKAEKDAGPEFLWQAMQAGGRAGAIDIEAFNPNAPLRAPRPANIIPRLEVRDEGDD